MINKIRDFIIGLRFKKYGHIKTRYDLLCKCSKEIKSNLIDTLLFINAITSAVKIAAIQKAPADTKQEKRNKANAIANSVIDSVNSMNKIYRLNL